MLVNFGSYERNQIYNHLDNLFLSGRESLHCSMCFWRYVVRCIRENVMDVLNIVIEKEVCFFDK